LVTHSPEKNLLPNFKKQFLLFGLYSDSERLILGNVVKERMSASLERNLAMQKKELLVLGLCTFMFSLFMNAQAATNSDLVALSRARVVKFTGTEHLSKPFAFDLKVTAPNRALNFANVVGQPLQLTIAPGRKIFGMVESLEQLSASKREGQYRVRIVPTLNRLAYRMTSRTFAELDPIQIVSGLLDEAGIPGLETRISSSVSPLEISVQYQESEFAYFSQLLENEGIHYHFELSGSGAKTVLGDSNNAFPVLSPGTLRFGGRTTPSITSFSRGLALHSGRAQAGDSN
jgi:uncharacterized protein involved in type VI secretion and phage assembly